MDILLLEFFESIFYVLFDIFCVFWLSHNLLCIPRGYLKSWAYLVQPFRQRKGSHTYKGGSFHPLYLQTRQIYINKMLHSVSLFLHFIVKSFFKGLYLSFSLSILNSNNISAFLEITESRCWSTKY